MDISDITAGGERMKDAMDLDPEVRMKVKEKLDEAFEMLASEGVDPAQAIMEIMGSTEDPMGESEDHKPGMSDAAKKALIIVLKKGRPEE